MLCYYVLSVLLNAQSDYDSTTRVITVVFYAISCKVCCKRIAPPTTLLLRLGQVVVVESSQPAIGPHPPLKMQRKLDYLR